MFKTPKAGIYEIGTGYPTITNFCDVNNQLTTNINREKLLSFSAEFLFSNKIKISEMFLPKDKIFKLNNCKYVALIREYIIIFLDNKKLLVSWIIFHLNILGNI